MESRRYMKWLVLLIGVLCSVGVKATDVSNETELRAAIERGDSYIRLSDNINQINLTKTLTVTSGENGTVIQIRLPADGEKKEIA